MNSWGATLGQVGYFWLLRSERGAGECRLLSGLPSYPVASGAVAGFLWVLIAGRARGMSA